jgi:hypothetical protein
VSERATLLTIFELIRITITFVVSIIENRTTGTCANFRGGATHGRDNFVTHVAPPVNG